MAASSIPNVVFVLGGPGAGKGTQCQMIEKELGFKHLSAGDLLRAERNDPESKVGEEIERHIVDGTIVPVEITVGLLHKAMIQSNQTNFLIDGFPRNQDNLDGWLSVIGDRARVLFTLFFDCDPEICIARCLSRGEASGRTDDNVDSLRKRIVTYNTQTLPIVKHFESKGLVKRVDASRSIDDVWSAVRQCFNTT